MGILASPPKHAMLKLTALVLGIVGGLIGLFQGLMLLINERISQHIKGRILDVPVGDPDSVRKLFAISDEIFERAQRKWWQPGRLDKSSRWGKIKDMIDSRIQVARLI